MASIRNTLTDSLNDVSGVLSQAQRRIANTIGAAQQSPDGSVETPISDTQRNLPQPARKEHRVRLTAFNFDRRNFDAGGTRNTLFGNDSFDNQEHLLHPLKEHGGILFPYTPTIVADFQATYGEYAPMHSITDFQAYRRTPSPTITVTTQLTVQNIDEGRYALACLHFARTVTKMYFGSNDKRAGTPPPILHFSGYGEYIFNSLPVVMTAYNIDFNSNTDYVEIPVTDANSNIQNITNIDDLTRCGVTGGNISNRETQNNLALKSGKSNNPGYSTAWLPSKFTFGVTLKVTRTPQQVRTFNLDEFRSGRLLTGSAGTTLNKSGGGWW